MVNLFFKIMGKIINILGFADHKTKSRILCRYLHNKTEINSYQSFIDEILVFGNFFCKASLLMKEWNSFWGDNTLLNWSSVLMIPITKINCKCLSVILICSEILYSSSLKMSFHTDKYCQMLISVYK